MIDLNQVGIGHPAERPFVKAIYNYTLLLRPNTVLEIGSGAFTFSQAILAALEETTATLYTFDPNPKTQYKHPQMQLFLDTSDQAAKLWKQPIDLLMIDGDHSYHQVKKDFVNFYPHVTPAGLIIFHDINVPSAPGVKKLWTEIKPHHNIQAEILTWPGLGVIQK